ncbi:hypothetical protein CIPAW_07G077000 [Carya illinoinensis]|uniref:Uncharacterized protein n=1 Tax=Carya illinoinensis TaxID=32201 RepID=A0A8T1PW47_CARIL|nr:hypothetical protein CIPAW_07G077000 [Carya illinoinensis]KAG6703324.1 hypothetical protein I3842_07G078200 [Carya illinoinensis]
MSSSLEAAHRRMEREATRLAQISLEPYQVNFVGIQPSGRRNANTRKLPNLRVLSGWEVFVGKQMVCLENGFPKLESLLLRGLLNLEEWTVESGAMPSLHHLKISNCIKLNEDGSRWIKVCLYPSGTGDTLDAKDIQT